MKICPHCRKTYPDDDLNFCLDDGSVLAAAAPANVPETVYNRPPQPTVPSSGIQGGWGQSPTHAPAPKKRSSRSWLWVVGILGAAVLFCGGGFAGLVAWIAYQSEATANSNSYSFDGPAPSSSPGEPSTTTPNVEAIDLSTWKNFSIYGTTDYQDGEFIMSSNNKGYYYVLVSTDVYSTEAARTRVKLRNINNSDTNLGYGLVFHSDPLPLQKDYAFLIDTKRQRYRVTRHEPDKEITIVRWTNFKAIKTGTSENELEAVDKGDTVDLFINGQSATTIKNTHGYEGGVPGLYTGDGVKVAFRGLEIRK